MTNGYLGAVKVILSIRRDPKTVQRASYGEMDFYFRGFDEQVLQEVLVDREYVFLSRLLREYNEPLVLDIGAHIGTFALSVLAVNPTARILSIEADPNTFEILTRNSREQSDKGMNWQTYLAAASAGDDETLRFSAEGPSMSHRIDEKGSITATGISLGTLISKIALNGESVDLAKVDIEGAEEQFLTSSPGQLKRIKAIVVELHPGLCDVKKVRGLLGDHYPHVEEIGGRKSTKPLLLCLDTHWTPSSA